MVSHPAALTSWCLDRQPQYHKHFRRRGAHQSQQPSWMMSASSRFDAVRHAPLTPALSRRERGTPGLAFFG